MKTLLDSHTLYWFAENSPQMSDKIKLLIENEQTENYVSVISIWELAIKAAIGKLILASPAEIYFADVLRANGFTLLPVTFDHAILAAKLPLHHKDPFDRLIIAQSLVEGIPIIGIDAVFDSYGVTPLVTDHRRQNGEPWTTRLYTQRDETIHLQSLEVTLTLAEIYESIVFPAPEAAAPAESSPA